MESFSNRGTDAFSLFKMQSKLRDSSPCRSNKRQEVNVLTVGTRGFKLELKKSNDDKLIESK